MKIFALISLLTLSINAYAQTITISHLEVNETSSSLLIHGRFGNITGWIKIGDTTAKVLSWTDSLVVCTIPVGGTGAAGPVNVVANGTSSNTHYLTSLYFSIQYYYYLQDGGPPFLHSDNSHYHCHLRCDFEDQRSYQSLQVAK